jgi:hypothetical protein
MTPSDSLTGDARGISQVLVRRRKKPESGGLPSLASRDHLPVRTAPFRLYHSAVPKDQKDNIRLLLDLIPLAGAALVIVGLMLGTGVVLLGYQADTAPKLLSVSGANASSILIARPQSDSLLPELSVGSITAKTTVNPTLGGTPARLHESFALNADADSPQFIAPTVSSKRWPVVRPRKAQSN